MSVSLETKGLHKNYGQKEAVQDVNLRMEAGQIWGILGPNGSGKTTTLGMILGVVKPTRGEVYWFGEKSRPAARKRIGSILEQPNFYPWLTCQQNLNVIGRLRGVKPTTQAIDVLLGQVGLKAAASKKYAELSLGMKQRLGIAACLFGDPEVIVLDEPTNGIDAEGIADIRSFIIYLGKKGKTVILASHILDEVEKVCSHTIILKEGQVIQKGAIKDVLAHDNTFKLRIEGENLKGDEVLNFLQGLDAVIEVKLQDEFYFVKLASSDLAAKVNAKVHSKGWEVSYLAPVGSRLEEQFVKLLKGD